MLSINIDNSRVLVEDELINKCGQYISENLRSNKALIISDGNVFRFYVEQIKSQLLMLGFQVYTFVIEPGDKQKTLKTVNKIYEILSLNFMTRSDVIVSVGGGVVTDISGFVAATYNRGMYLVHIPTSFLAMVDASIGGKNGVNSKYGKNLIGTFYYPNLIIIDPSVLKTLPENELRFGIAETIKYGCIKDRKLFELLENENFEDVIDEIIYRSIAVKKQLVERDRYDFGDRMILNFGHTIGHALERLYGYENISHGEAVSIGMNMFTKVSEKMNLTDRGTSDRLRRLCKKYGLPTEINLTYSKIIEFILRDKKNLNGQLNFILLKNIGSAFIYKIRENDIIDFVREAF